MKPAPFDYHRPDRLHDALAILADAPDATVIAGGQSLLPMLNLRVASADLLVDISRLSQLRMVSEHDDAVTLGALVTHAMLEDGLGQAASGGLLQAVAAGIAYRAVRNVGTIGGSLALCDPAADWPVCLLAMNAQLAVASRSRTQSIAMEDFLVDAYETALAPDDLLLSVTIPRAAIRWGVSKVARKSGAFADSLSVAIAGEGSQASRIALGGTSGCARLLHATAALVDNEVAVSTEAMRQAIMADVQEIHPDATPYQQRCHIHTVTCAIKEAGIWLN